MKTIIIILFSTISIFFSCRSSSQRLVIEQECGMVNLVSKSSPGSNLSNKANRQHFYSENCQISVDAVHDTCGSFIYFFLYLSKGDSTFPVFIDSIEKVLYVSDSLFDYNKDGQIDYIISGETYNGKYSREFSRFFTLNRCTKFVEDTLMGSSIVSNFDK